MKSPTAMKSELCSDEIFAYAQMKFNPSFTRRKADFITQ